MSLKKLRGFLLLLALSALTIFGAAAFAQHEGHDHAKDDHGASGKSGLVENVQVTDPHKPGAESHDAKAGSGHSVGAAHKGEHHGGEHETPGTFDPHAGTWLHWIARFVFEGGKPVEVVEHDGEKHFKNIKSDFQVVALFIMVCLAAAGVIGARNMKVRPEGKPMSLSHIVETAVEGYRNYIVGIMGPSLAGKYAPLISCFFFTILFFNWIGLVPGMLAPTSNPNIPVSFAIVAFVAVHFIAIKEAGIKSWFMHLVGEPLWLAPLNFPLHLIGEIIKPISLAVRLLGNVFGEEMVVLNLSLLAIGIMAMLKVPIPLQFPMLCLGLFFGMLQALVFSTLLAIYISILSTHHDDHDDHNAHGHVEHVNDHGHDRIIAHPSETTIA